MVINIPQDWCGLMSQWIHIDRNSIRNPWKFGFDFCAVKIVTLLGQVDLRILGIIESLLAMYSVNTGIFLFLHFLKIFKNCFLKREIWRMAELGLQPGSISFQSPCTFYFTLLLSFSVPVEVFTPVPFWTSL